MGLGFRKHSRGWLVCCRSNLWTSGMHDVKAAMSGNAERELHQPFAQVHMACSAEYHRQRLGKTTVVSRAPLPDFDPRYCDIRLHEVVLQLPKSVLARVNDHLDQMEATGAVSRPLAHGCVVVCARSDCVASTCAAATTSRPMGFICLVRRCWPACQLC